MIKKLDCIVKCYRIFLSVISWKLAPRPCDVWQQKCGISGEWSSRPSTLSFTSLLRKKGHIYTQDKAESSTMSSPSNHDKAESSTMSSPSNHILKVKSLP